MGFAIKQLQSAVAHHQAGRLKEAEAAYLQVLKSDAKQKDALRLLGALYLQARQPVQAAAYLERALLLAPSLAEIRQNLTTACYNAGIMQQADGKAEAAEASYRRCLQLQPGHMQALNNLANLLRQRGDAAAGGLYETLVALNPPFPEAYNNHAVWLLDNGRADEAAPLIERALALKPGHPETLMNRAALHYAQRRFGEALADYDAVLKADTEHRAARWHKALTLLQLGDYGNGWALYESGLGHRDMRGTPAFSERRWDGAPFPGKRLLLCHEQGLGDSLMFIRFASLCGRRSGGGSVQVLCPPPLARLFSALPEIDRVMTSAGPGDFDVQAGLLSLPHLLGATLETLPAEVPYLRVPSGLNDIWAPRVAAAARPGRIKAGLVWAGGAHQNLLSASLLDRRRSVPLVQLEPLLGCEGVSFFSLQVGPAAEQIRAAGWEGRMADLTGDISDFADTAALVSQLDLVITVDTSVAHLAGALGRPVWVLSRYDACWRWPQGQSVSRWYPSARIFGQPQPGDWKSVIGDVAAALKAEVARTAQV